MRPSGSVFKGLTPVLAIDCEMVGTDGNCSSIARVSLVNYNGYPVYDKFVRPDARITDYRTWVSGISPGQLRLENGAISEK